MSDQVQYLLVWEKTAGDDQYAAVDSLEAAHNYYDFLVQDGCYCVHICKVVKSTDYAGEEV